MRWPDWLNPHQMAINADASVELGSQLAADLANPTAAKRAIRELRDERKMLVQRRNAVEKRFKRLTKLDANRITRSSRLSLDMQVYQFSEAIRDASAADRDGAALKEQIAAIEMRIQGRAIAKLRAVSR